MDTTKAEDIVAICDVEALKRSTEECVTKVIIMNLVMQNGEPRLLIRFPDCSGEEFVKKMSMAHAITLSILEKVRTDSYEKSDDKKHDMSVA